MSADESSGKRSGGSPSAGLGHESPLAENLERRLAAGFAVIFLILAVIVVEAVRSTLRTRETSLWVNNTHAVLLETSAILSAVNALESAHSSVVLRGRPEDHENWQRAYSDLEEHIQVAKALTADNSRQVQHLREVDALVRRRMEFSKRLMEARKANGVEAGRSLLVEGDGAGSVAEIRTRLSKMAREENDLLLQRDQASVANARSTRFVLYAGMGLNALLLVCGYFLVRDDLKVRRAQAAFLAGQNELLERRVVERTRELAEANEALKVENLERQWAYVSLEKNYRHGELIVESLAEAIFLVGTTGLIHRSNPSGEQALGLASGGAVGRKLEGLLTPVEGWRSWPEHPVKLAMRENRILKELPALLVHTDGRRIVVSCQVRPIEDSGQVVMAIVGVTLPPV